jgi:hypothetical protein
MTMKTKIATVLAALSVATGSLTSIASTASAGPYHGHEDVGRAWHGGGDEGRGYASHGFEGAYGHHDHAGRYVAVGAFAAVLGLALAAEARRVRDHYYDDRD